MSDGPHRSLLLRRYWKKALERGENHAFSSKEICEPLALATKKEFSKEILGIIIREIGNEMNATLPFPDERVQRLEDLRTECRGSVADNTLIECVIEAVLEGQDPGQAVSNGLKNAAEEVTNAHLRSMKEHCLRKTDPRTAYLISDRMYEAAGKMDFSAVASDIISEIESGTSNSKKLRKKPGLEEGPEL